MPEDTYSHDAPHMIVNPATELSFFFGSCKDLSCIISIYVSQLSANDAELYKKKKKKKKTVMRHLKMCFRDIYAQQRT